MEDGPELGVRARRALPLLPPPRRLQAGARARRAGAAAGRERRRSRCSRSATAWSGSRSSASPTSPARAASGAGRRALRLRAAPLARVRARRRPRADRRSPSSPSLLWFVGYPDQALARVREAQRLAERLAAPYSRAFALSFSAWIHVRRGEAAAAAGVLRRAPWRSPRSRGSRFLLAEGAIFRGWALAAAGKGRGRASSRCSRASPRSVPTAPRWAGRRTSRCSPRPSAWASRPEEGLRVLDEALATVSATGRALVRGRAPSTEGRAPAPALRSARGGREPWRARRERVCGTPLDVARSQGARSLELRAALSLVRLEGTRRRGSQARRLLRDVYASFTEGFDTPDLTAAARFLDAQPARTE